MERYDVTRWQDGSVTMSNTPDGEWVRYLDYESFRERIEKNDHNNQSNDHKTYSAKDW